MTKFVILSTAEHLRFDSTPKFNADDRALYFSLTSEEIKLVRELRTATNKVGFILQLLLQGKWKILYCRTISPS